MGKERQTVMPEVPTLTELGIAGFEDVPYFGIFAPTGTPPAVLERLSKALAQTLEQPRVRERLTAMGLDVGFMSGAELNRRERAYTQTWAHASSGPAASSLSKAQSP